MMISNRKNPDIRHKVMAKVLYNDRYLYLVAKATHGACMNLLLLNEIAYIDPSFVIPRDKGIKYHLWVSDDSYLEEEVLSNKEAKHYLMKR